MMVSSFPRAVLDQIIKSMEEYYDKNGNFISRHYCT